jgi:uncharacterized protein YggE
VICLWAACASFGETTDRQFGVSGFGRVFYEPDAFDLLFGIVTEDVDVQVCKERHLAATKNVKSFLDEHKAQFVSLKQDATVLGTSWQNVPRAPSDRGRVYRFESKYMARIKNPTSLVLLQEGLISSGVTDIYELDTFSENMPKLFEQARKEAIKDAKGKAQLAAQELGWSLQSAASISFQDGEDPYYYWRVRGKASQAYGSRVFAYDRDQRPEFTNYVTAQVQIMYRFTSADAGSVEPKPGKP